MAQGYALHVRKEMQVMFWDYFWHDLGFVALIVLAVAGVLAVACMIEPDID
jgi:hypothetical protein